VLSYGFNQWTKNKVLDFLALERMQSMREAGIEKIDLRNQVKHCRTAGQSVSVGDSLKNCGLDESIR
jgi:hypothetical protein